jgi:hypothetical protein
MELTGETTMKTTRAYPRRLRGRAALAVGSAIAAGAALALTATGAPSALAATGGTAKPAVATQSYRVSMITTETFTPQSGGGHIVDMNTQAAFDPARHVSTETLPVHPEIPAVTAIRYIGRYAYLYFPVPEPGRGGTDGLHWLKAQTDAPYGNFVDNLPIDAVMGLVTPKHLLAELRSLTTLHNAGRARGPGWTGTRYTFTAQDIELDSVPPATIYGSVTVDRQGRVRQLLLLAIAPGSYASITGIKTLTINLTFRDFGVRVRVPAPRASQVYNPSPRAEFILAFEIQGPPKK